MPGHDIHWITNNQSLSDSCRIWQQLPYLALDTEFVRVRTYYPIAGLLQISDGRSVWLIDPLTITDWSPYVELLKDERIIKVLHAGGEDLEVFQHLFAALPTPLFDTQLAAAYLGMPFSIGFSRLVNEILHVDLPKEATRSDWLQRPLSPIQVQYAADDAYYLAHIYEYLQSHLSAEKYSWVIEDGDDLTAAALNHPSPRTLYRDIKQAWKLNPSQLAVLRELTAWREEQAKIRDMPRNHLLKEVTLFELARLQPDQKSALAQIPEMHPRIIRQDGDTLITLIRQARQLPETQWPVPLEEPLPIQASAVIKRLRALAHQEAAALGIAPELMLRKKVMQALVQSGYPNGPYQLPDSLHGWRRERMGQALLDLLENP